MVEQRLEVAERRPQLPRRRPERPRARVDLGQHGDHEHPARRERGGEIGVGAGRGTAGTTTTSYGPGVRGQARVEVVAIQRTGAATPLSRRGEAPTGEMSTASTTRPRCASHTATPPRPQATSRARPAWRHAVLPAAQDASGGSGPTSSAAACRASHRSASLRTPATIVGCVGESGRTTVDGWGWGPRVGDVVAPARLGRSFRFLMATTWVSNLGDGIALAAGPLLVASLTDSPLLIALGTTLQRLRRCCWGWSWAW